MLDDQTRFRVDPETTGKIIDGEAVIIHLGTGYYYSLNPSGSELWELISKGHGVAAMARSLSVRYGLGEDRARRDVEALLGRLLEEGLVQPDGTTEEAPPAPAAAPAPAYEPPELSVYTDMADLLALDPPVPGLAPEAWDEPEDDSPGNG